MPTEKLPVLTDGQRAMAELPDALADIVALTHKVHLALGCEPSGDHAGAAALVAFFLADS